MNSSRLIVATLTIGLLGACAPESAVRSGTVAVEATLPTIPAAATTAATTTPATSTTATTATTNMSTTTTAVSTTTTTDTTTINTTTTTTTTASTTTVPPTAELVIGSSVQGRPIVARRRGTPGGAAVVVVGAIHGNEEDGVRIVEALEAMEVPEGIELWLLPTLNPDGLAVGTRRNANGVDLNRNFPAGWEPILDSVKQNAGSGPASEPETQAFVAWLEQLGPVLTVWYHQDLNAIAPSSGPDGPLRQRYSELSGIPIGKVSQPGGKYTGTAAAWARQLNSESMSFVIELPGTLTDAEVRRNAAAMAAITEMLVPSG